MGCGGSSANAPPPQQQQQQQQQQEKPKELTQEEKNEIAVRGLKDALKWAASGAVELGKVEDTWKEEEIEIQVPDRVMSKITKLKETVEKVPLVGSGLAEALDKTTEPFEENFRNAGMAVASDERVYQTFEKIIEEVKTNEAIELCRSGGVTACVDYLRENSRETLKEQMTPIVNSVMESHTLTNVWKGCIDKYNSAADKAPGIEPLEFDLNEYVLNSTLESLFKLMMRKEQEIRAAPSQAVSVYVQQAFGQKDPSQWKKQA